MNSIIQVALAVALGVIVCAAVQVFWQWWQEADGRQRRLVLREAARWAVLAAEELHRKPGSGPTKLTWVLTQLRARFPDLDDATMTRMAEKMVASLNANRAAAEMARLNGKGPRHDNSE